MAIDVSDVVLAIADVGVSVAAVAVACLIVIVMLRAIAILKAQLGGSSYSSDGFSSDD